MLGIIHIGTEKTGSSSIQDFLRTNSDSLREAGVATLSSTGNLDDRNLVTCSMNPYLVDDHVSLLGIEDLSERTQWRGEFRKQFLQECDEVGDSCDTLLLTSEHFHSRLSSSEEVAALFDLLSDVCSEFKVIVYLRRQDRMASSLASTYFKTGLSGGIPGYRDHLRRLVTNSHYFDYLHLLSIWSDVFSEQSIIPRLYNKDKFHENDLLSDFTKAAGIPVEKLAVTQAERNNVSLSNPAIMALEAFSDYFPIDDSDERRPSNERLRERFIQHLENELPGHPSIFTQEEAEHFYSQFRKSNNEVARRWFDSESLFEEDFSSYPSSLDGSANLSEQLDAVLAFFADEVQTVSKKLAQGTESDSSETDSAIAES